MTEQELPRLDLVELKQVYKLCDDVLKAELELAGRGTKVAKVRLRKALMLLAKEAKAARKALSPEKEEKEEVVEPTE